MPITYTEESTATFPAPAAGGRMTFIDADGDGDMDILFQTGGDGSPFQYARSNGDGTYTILDLVDSPFAGLTLPNHSGGNFHVADIDGDGDDDIWAGPNFSTGSFFRNDGGGVFSAQSTASFPVVGASSRLLLGDYDGDGDADILYQTAGNGSPFAYAESNGDGTYTLHAIGDSPFAGLTLPDHTGSNYFLADFDGDGDEDVWVAVNNTTGSYFRNDGEGILSAQSSASFPAPAAAGRVAVADFDSDGDYDILYQTGANGSPWAYAESNGDGTFTILAQADSPFAGVSLLDHNGSNILAEDVDGDGDHDLIITPNGGTGEFYMAGFKPPALVSTTPADEDTGVDTNPTITLTFDEAVAQGSGDIHIYRDDGTLIETIDVTSGQVTGSGATWTIDPSVVLSGLTGYYVLIDSGSFVDSDGSIFGGISNPATLNFTTEPATPPTFANLDGDIVGFTEAGAAVQLDAGGNLTITDAEQVNFAGGVLIASIATGHAVGEDVLRIANQGTGAGQIGVSGSDVTYEGVVIGSFTGGTGTDDLVVTLNADASIAATQALARALQYDNTNDTTASTSARTVEITLSDGLGATSAVQTVTVNVADNDPSPGNDLIIGTFGHDVLNGYGGNDVVIGLTGHDTLNGGAGDDILWGGIGNDVLNGGAGKDILWGGLGADRFVLDASSLKSSSLGQTPDRDTIADFSRLSGDKIDLSAIDAVPGGADNAFTFVSSFSGAAGQATLSHSGLGTTLRLDVDGDGQADAEVLILGANLTASSGVWIL